MKIRYQNHQKLETSDLPTPAMNFAAASEELQQLAQDLSDAERQAVRAALQLLKDSAVDPSHGASK